MPAHRTPYGAVERHLKKQNRDKFYRSHRANREGLSFENGYQFVVGHESNGIPNIEDGGDGDGGANEGTKIPTVTIGNPKPTPTEDDFGKFYIQYEAGLGSVLYVCLNDGADNYSWEPIVSKSAGGP
jgi:hypothetical protein